MKIIYLIGEPGSGKTTLTEAFTRSWTNPRHYEKPIKYRVHDTPQGAALSLGWLRPNFGGTDTLGNAAIVSIEPWLPTITDSYEILYGEGDRLANDRFFNLCRANGDFHLFYLDTDPEIAKLRRYERSLATGKEQNPTWVKGRSTKHKNLAAKWNAIPIPGGLTPEQGADLISRNVFS
jgi:ABC-type dipeptide/oligopeptide/nickel transport system ATPase component